MVSIHIDRIIEAFDFATAFFVCRQPRHMVSLTALVFVELAHLNTPRCLMKVRPQSCAQLPDPKVVKVMLAGGLAVLALLCGAAEASPGAVAWSDAFSFGVNYYVPLASPTMEPKFVMVLVAGLPSQTLLFG